MTKHHMSANQTWRGYNFFRKYSTQLLNWFNDNEIKVNTTQLFNWFNDNEIKATLDKLHLFLSINNKLELL